MGMMLKPRCNRRNVWGKGLLDQKCTDESVKDQGDAGCVFSLERLCPSWICPTWSDGKQLYQEVLARLRDAVCRKRPELWKNQTWMLHHNNAPAHTSLLTCTYVTKCQTSVLPHAPYSPDLAPADFFLFPKLKTTLKGRRFQTIKEIQENAIRELRATHRKCVPESIITMEETLGTVYRQ